MTSREGSSRDAGRNASNTGLLVLYGTDGNPTAIVDDFVVQAERSIDEHFWHSWPTLNNELFRHYLLTYSKQVFNCLTGNRLIDQTLKSAEIFAEIVILSFLHGWLLLAVIVTHC